MRDACGLDAGEDDFLGFIFGAEKASTGDFMFDLDAFRYAATAS